MMRFETEAVSDPGDGQKEMERGRELASAEIPP